MNPGDELYHWITVHSSAFKVDVGTVTFPLGEVINAFVLNAPLETPLVVSDQMAKYGAMNQGPHVQTRLIYFVFDQLEDAKQEITFPNIIWCFQHADDEIFDTSIHDRISSTDDPLPITDIRTLNLENDYLPIEEITGHGEDLIKFRIRGRSDPCWFDSAKVERIHQKWQRRQHD